MVSYGELLPVVTLREREDLDRMIDHCVALGRGAVGALDVLPTLPYIVERITILAGRYDVPIPQLTEAERVHARAEILRSAGE